MEYFSIEDPKAATPQVAGFEGSEFQPESVDDNQVNIPVEKINKMGSSIPSVYARLFLFSSAFKQVNKYENDAKGMGQLGIKDKNKQTVPTSYHYLVSECLDMLEFIYIYGGQKEFSIIDYNIAKETDALLADGAPEHARLANALIDAKSFGLLQNMTDIYLFTWNEKIIGGTSPLTLVYTSPNVRSLGLPNKGGAGKRLFGNEATPLHMRSEGFRKFMYNYIFVEKLDGKSHFLSKYVTDSLANYDKAWQNAIKDNPDLGGCQALAFNDRTIDLDGKGTHLYFDFKPLDLTNCGYVIQPSAGKTVNNPPLVLNDNGLDGVEYVNGRTWAYGEDHLPEVREEELGKRQLPSTAYVYPYLTIDDFVESKIIATSYKLSTSKFYLGADIKKAEYLLPLKKTFFDYFTAGDINKIVKVDNEDEDCVTVELTIPIKAGSIVLKKTYRGDDIVDGFAQANVFNIAIFPFYKLLPTNGVNNNKYEVMLGTRGGDINILFHKDDGSQVSATGQARSQADDKTFFYGVNGSFEWIEVQVDGTSGVIAPQWTTVDLKNANSDFYFCIDFGTTNTHITYAKVNAPDGNVRIVPDNVCALDITGKDQQVVTLDDNDTGEFMNFRTKLMQEFVPSQIGQGQITQFPMRTATCQVNRMVTKLSMFGNMNIGFYYDHDISELGNNPQYYYNTNIKWNRADIHSSDRMAEYFKQALWMMKNKALLNRGTDQIHLTYTYPQSMSDSEVSKIQAAWQNAANDLHINQANISSVYEGVAPYYSFLKDMKFGAAYMNMDIGGGTTDIFYRNPKTHEDYSFSAFFAANDLWGDGANPNSTPKSNGILQAYKKSQEYKALAERKSVDSVLGNGNSNVKSSADAISYLFSHGDTTRFGQFVSDDPLMIQLPIAHFACLVYYAAMVIDTMDLDAPATLSFTGMGSLYVKMISGREESVSKLVDVIFHYCGKTFNNDGLKASHVSVKFADEPKVVTAAGGLIQNTRSEKMSPGSIFCYGYDGEGGSSTLRYRDIDAKKEAVMKAYDHFLGLFDDEEFIDTIDELKESVDIQQVATQLKEFKEVSYDVMAGQNNAPTLKNKKIKEPLFFWCIKDALYHAGVELSRP